MLTKSITSCHHDFVMLFVSKQLTILYYGFTSRWQFNGFGWYEEKSEYKLFVKTKRCITFYVHGSTQKKKNTGNLYKFNIY